MKKYFLLILLFFFFSGCGLYSSPQPINTNHSEILASPTPFAKETRHPEVLNSSLVILKDMENFTKYLPTLMFHHINNTSANDPNKVEYNLSYSPEKFEQFLMFFQENHIETLTFWDLKGILEGKRSFPERYVMLTFDDGFEDQYLNAFPLLKKYHMKGVFFIISNRPGNDHDYATWKQIQEMAEDGQEIASHSVTHPDLSVLPDQKLADEIQKSKKTIEFYTEKPVISFCYPSGEYNEKVVKMTKEHYLFARTTKKGKYFSVANRYEMPMIRISPTTELPSLSSWLQKSNFQSSPSS
ncbi:MAG: polysaccharide deacetylase family protein [Candidatus Peregrinibacteria bacterium]